MSFWDILLEGFSTAGKFSEGMEGSQYGKAIAKYLESGHDLETYIKLAIK